eukprot:1609343-Prymnesium_polylepis.1
MTTARGPKGVSAWLFKPQPRALAVAKGCLHLEYGVTLTFNASTLQRCIIPWRPYEDYKGGEAAAVWTNEGVHQSYSESLVAECFA